MTAEMLQKILNSDDKLSLSEVKEIIYRLKNDCLSPPPDPEEGPTKYEYGFYNGESNAFYICLDLLGKVSDDKLPMGHVRRVNVIADALGMSREKDSREILDEAIKTLRKGKERIGVFPSCYLCSDCERDVVICQEEGRCMKNGKDTV